MFDINIHAGADFRLTFYMRDPEGNLIDLTGCVIQAQLKPFAESPDAIDFVVQHNGAGGRCQLSLSKSTTEQIDFDKGVYDVMITDPDENRKKVLWGMAKVIPAVTRPVPILPIDLELVIVPNVAALPQPGIMYRIWYCYETGVFYIWDGEQYRVMNTEANWDTMVNKPETFPPESHNHDDRYYTENEVDTLLGSKADTADLGSLAYESSVDYDTEVTGKPTLGALAGKDAADWSTDIDNIPAEFPPSSHTHDDRYYTEAETDALLANKIGDAPSDGSRYVRQNGDWVVTGGGGGASAWGEIEGDLEDQTDLKDALDAKADAADLGALADHDTVDYTTELTNKPTLGTLASQDTVDYDTDVTNKPTLGALAAKDSVTASTDSVGSATAGTAISADDITDWSAGTLPGAVYDDATETLEISFGSLPSLSYTSRSIPNISVTSKTVVTGITTA